jgi:hypothetical protein
MIHLRALPGSPQAEPMERVVEAALQDARALIEAGFDGLMVENFGDAPFFAERVPAVTVAAMSRVVSTLRAAVGQRVQLGVNVLRNDAAAALSIAAACGADAIRVNVHSGARVTDQGLITGQAADTVRLRHSLQAEGISIWADVAVKHSAPLGQPRPLPEEVAELVGRGRADAVIVTGSGTGKPVDLAELGRVRRALPAGAALLVGSGVTAQTVGALLDIADGVIVGTSVKEGLISTAPVDPQRARALVGAIGGRR